ncbi:PAS domain S-box protein [Thermanaerosceptrum fracticalcis]|jgi:PAS domain S-box-containing protein|uniref:histidine kinase n=1 Tax=Thermanaerosceptrum fracticalcis TaxID=1712410 RepID=A0A7G6DYW5_THEFR|nr:ATP-binding protein [Thermanaerosceptrum fracticalcis]QNB45019.1 PAS domain S-box protein [Thermanaerosceptrum fracticalcis]
MYYKDVSCYAQNSLKKIEGLGLGEIIPVDWMAIITVSKRGRLIFEGEIDYSNIGPYLHEYLKTHMAEIYRINDVSLAANNNERESLDIILSPIREEENYKVFFVVAGKNLRYREKDLKIVRFTTKIVYENVLLNNEIVQEKNYLRNIFDSTESAIISIDLQGKITTANKAVKAVFGIEPEKIVGNNYERYLGGKARKVLEEGMSYVQEHNNSFLAREILFTNKFRGKIVLDIAFTPLNDSKKNVVGIVLIIRDVTNKRVLERELEQLKQFAILGELAAGIAHDIKNPLMNIRGCARILEKSLLHQPGCQEFLEPIIHEVDRINEVVEQMLSYVDITKQNSYALLNINEVLNKCYNVILCHKESKHIVIERDLASELPLIRGNNVQLQQAFVNILLNAVQSIEKEGMIRIISSDISGEKRILISIIDNGIGISPREIGKIFAPFYSTKKNGTGLGLSIVEKVIKEHKGEIKINSKCNQGTRVDVFLPY